MHAAVFPAKRLNFFFLLSRFDLLRFNTTTNNNNMGRRKNPHPQRAVNARTVLKVRREEPLVFLRIPDEDDFEANHQIQKEEEEEEEEETAFIAKGVKRKRGHECDVCGKMCARPSELTRHMRTHTNERP